jgi:hypothetical protein
MQGRAARVEDHPVVAALEAITGQLASRERIAAVAAAVLQRDHRAVLGAIEHDRLVE